MFTTKHFIGRLGLILIFLLSACTPSGITPTLDPLVSPEPEVTVQPSACNLMTWPNLMQRYPNNWVGQEKEQEFDLEHQLIVVGLPPAIEETLNKVEATQGNIYTALLGTMTLGTGEVHFYGISASTTALLAASYFNDYANTSGLAAYAEPNAPLEAGYNGHPWSVGGDPTVGGPEVLNVTAPIYWEQWAYLGKFGLRANNLPSPAWDVKGGKGVKVVIFDTSPFNYAPIGTASAHLEQFSHWFPGSTTGTPLDQMQLCVYDPGNIAEGPTAGQPDYSSHGLFVAGLVFGAAPEAELHLVRVLDDEAQGAHSWLLASLIGLLNGGQITSQPTVVNLSLGLNPNDLGWKLADIGSDPAQLQRVADAVLGGGPANAGLPFGPYFPLALAISALRQQKVVVIAATGNDSQPGRLQEAQFPASYPAVIPMQASNVNGGLACYSNAHLANPLAVQAPGGDAEVGTPCQPFNLQTACNNDFTSCSASAKGAVVISLVLGQGANYAKPLIYQDIVNNEPEGRVKVFTGFAAWQGTSFATALASGWAAVLLAQGHDPYAAANGQLYLP